MLLNLAIGLAKTGRISPCSSFPPDTGPLAALATAHGIGYAEIPGLPGTSTKSGFGQELLVRIALQAQGYCQVMQQYPLDVVVVNTLTSLPPVMAAMKLQIPYVAWVHGISDAGLLRRPSPLSRVGENLTLQRGPRGCLLGVDRPAFPLSDGRRVASRPRS